MYHAGSSSGRNHNEREDVFWLETLFKHKGCLDQTFLVDFLQKNFSLIDLAHADSQRTEEVYCVQVSVQ